MGDGHCDGMVKTMTGTGMDEIELLKQQGLNFGGWISAGITYNTDSPNSHNNTPVTFNDRTSEFQLNQLNFFLEKSINVQSKAWDFGGRVDFMFGTDTRYTQATGWDNQLISPRDLRFYDLAIPQAYVEVFAPFGKGVTAKIGHFYTLLGNESVMATNNFFYSHTYTMQYGEPFTHTGALFNYALNDNFTINAGSVAGWDNVRENLANWNFLGGLTWANDEATTSIAWSVISGDVDDVTSENRTVSALVFSHNVTDKLQYVFQHDFGYQQKASSSGKDAFWYDINQYVFYELTETLSAGFRGEWFRDANGVRLLAGNKDDYFALTGGINWKPLQWLTLRPEIRYDWVNTKANVFDTQTRKNQLNFAVDVVIEF
jgi:hypothetical protein